MRKKDKLCVMCTERRAEKAQTLSHLFIDLIMQDLDLFAKVLLGLIYFCYKSMQNRREAFDNLSITINVTHYH